MSKLEKKVCQNEVNPESILFNFRGSFHFFVPNSIVLDIIIDKKRLCSIYSTAYPLTFNSLKPTSPIRKFVAPSFCSGKCRSVMTIFK